MMQEFCAFLARAPALQGIVPTVGNVGPAPGTAGLWCGGITTLWEKQNLLGGSLRRCRAEFTLRLCLPRTEAENAERLLDLQAWCAAQSAAHRVPAFGNTDIRNETLRAEQGHMERADAGGTAVYAVRLRAEYTIKTEEEL